jgi:hypothetical protein
MITVLNSIHPAIAFRKIRSYSGFLLLFSLLLLPEAKGKEKVKEFNYLRNGVSFSLPSTWKIISDESLPDKGNYISAESTGKKSTGLFTLVTINEEQKPAKALLVHMQNMKESDLYKETGIEFTAIEAATFGSMEGRKLHYESIVKGTKISGTIYCFNCSEKTYLVFMQTGLKDKKSNLKAFNLIEITFACR